MKNWIYQKGDNAIRVISDDPEAVNNEDVVLYVDDVNPEVIEEVVNLYNAGKDTTEIDAYLLNEEKCTQDEREFIMENIVNYINLIEKMENQNQTQNEQFPDNLEQEDAQVQNNQNNSQPLPEPEKKEKRCTSVE